MTILEAKILEGEGVWVLVDFFMVDFSVVDFSVVGVSLI
jgi:hypothetical protein